MLQILIDMPADHFTNKIPTHYFPHYIHISICMFRYYLVRIMFILWPYDLDFIRGVHQYFHHQQCNTKTKNNNYKKNDNNNYIRTGRYFLTWSKIYIYDFFSHLHDQCSIIYLNLMT